MQEALGGACKTPFHHFTSILTVANVDVESILLECVIFKKLYYHRHGAILHAVSWQTNNQQFSGPGTSVEGERGFSVMM
ncbi:hypothetical protein LSH36_316g05013 [Paralvinella palmiformis]|uniref:Uncharacterized protein n=1 Tax=Paralvinella palmiformis TaxID=53620 RepID=A0AAD9JH34_9ANNE|nr:hypothetical protein LSH36_316g05013 [Paralvinella palmiformis]